VTLDVFRRYGNLLRPDGTNQLQRLLPGLESDYVVPDERDFSALIEYARRVAAEVRFYDLSGQATGDWQGLLELLLIPGTQTVKSTEDLQVMLASRSDWPPHLVLFLVFLKLFEFLQRDINELTQRHLLHYYEKELGLARRPAAGDAVHVIFELAQNAVSTLLRSGTRLDGGKDGEGRALVYTTQNDLVVSKATVADVRRLVVETDVSQVRRLFTAGAFTEFEAPGGYTFGRRQLELEPAARFMAETSLGFVVAAPILKMAEGNRTITLRAHLQPDPDIDPVITQGLASGLEIALTGAEGWLAADSFEATLLANGGLGMPALLLTVTVGVDSPAIVAADATLHGAGLAGARPALRCLAKGEAGVYELFTGFTVQRIDFDVDVKGMRTLVVQNDESLLESGKPLAPFGSQPRIGSAFYAGSGEIFGKRVTRIDAHLEWKSPPEDFIGHYSEYFDFKDAGLTDAFYTEFQVDVDLLYEREFHTLLTDMPLFEPVSAAPHTITATAPLFDTALSGIAFEEHPDLEEPVAGFGGTSRFGFLRFRLSGPTRASMQGYAVQAPFEAFGHSSFAMRYAVQAIALSASPPPPDPKPKFPKEPYTPVLSSFSLDYHATATMLPAEALAEEQYYVVQPFGVRRARVAADARLVPLLENSAALFLGIGGLAAPANVSLYFDIDVGTATGSEALVAGDTQWSFLDTGDVWRPLDAAAILIEGTQAFQKPGVIEISVPIEASLTTTSMPTGLLWLRAQIAKAPENAARTLSIRPQAVLATFDRGALPIETYAAHLEAGLPALTISKLVTRNAAIKRIEQPSASFGGHGEEGTSEFIRRGSERLRHRNRAITPWDYERLVLERFPDIYKVKCLPHTDETVAPRAGHTALVIVPNLRRGGASNPLEPRAGDVLLGEVADYLDDLATPFARLHVIRPAFERLRVEAKVVFTRGRDPGYFAQVLNEDLRRFLSPWAYQEGEDILFGARIYRSDILAFIEGREYVDHIIGLRVYHSFEGERRDGISWMKIGVDFVVTATPQPALEGMTIGDDFIVGRPVEVAGTTQPHAILVSHPEHLITPVAAGAEICSGTTRLGIGYMTIGLDFDVGLETPA
jgi:hypothetical protein